MVPPCDQTLLIARAHLVGPRGGRDLDAMFGVGGADLAASTFRRRPPSRLPPPRPNLHERMLRARRPTHPTW